MYLKRSKLKIAKTSRSRVKFGKFALEQKNKRRGRKKNGEHREREKKAKKKGEKKKRKKAKEGTNGKKPIKDDARSFGKISRCHETNLAGTLTADKCLPRFWQRRTVIQITNNTPPSTFYPTPGDKLLPTWDGLARNYPHHIPGHGVTARRGLR